MFAIVKLLESLYNQLVLIIIFIGGIMKKLLFPLLVLVLILAACGNKSDSDKKEETKSYKLDSGKSIDIPKNLKE